MIPFLLFLLFIQADALADALCAFAIFSLWHLRRHASNMRVSLQALTRRYLIAAIIPVELLHLPFLLGFTVLCAHCCGNLLSGIAAILMAGIAAGRHILILRHLDDIKHSF